MNIINSEQVTPQNIKTSPIFLVVGPPAVGKSTTSRALASHFSKSVHIPVDDLRSMVVCGLLLPGPVWSDELAQQVALARKGAINIAVNYRQAGFAVVMDDFWDSDHLSDYQGLFDQPEVHTVLLLPDQAAAFQRNRKRSGGDTGNGYIDEGIRIVYEQISREVNGGQTNKWLVIDTTEMDAEATVEYILTHCQL